MEVPLLVFVGQAWRGCRLVVAIKVLRISLVLDLRNPWWWYLPLQNHLPVDASEPFVILDLLWPTN